MTEAEWLSCTDPERMLRCLLGRVEFVTSVLRQLRRPGYESRPRPADERRLRLYACACCRRIAALMTDERSRLAVEVAERLADGRAGPAELAAARRGALRAAETLVARAGRSLLPLAYQPPVDQVDVEIMAARAALEVTVAPDRAVAMVARGALLLVAERRDPDWSRWAIAAAGPAARVALIRDVFGNPFREVPVDPSWLRWNDGTLPRIARGIYDERAFDRLPILHDALVDAGCDDEAMLAHCREPDGHVRGCWVIDRLLGRP